MLERIPNPNLRAYVVWLPVLPSGGWESAARRESRRVPSTRAIHYYDADAHLSKLYGPILHLPEGMPAWDVYFVFGAEVRWGDQPPAPTYWMHQLGGAAPDELRLDGDQLARVVTGLLAGASRERGSGSVNAGDDEPVRADPVPGAPSGLQPH